MRRVLALPAATAAVCLLPTPVFAVAAVPAPAPWQWLALILAGAALVFALAGLVRSSRLKREALRSMEAAQRLRAMTAVLPGGLFQALHTPGGAPRFVFVDPRMEEVFGIPPRKLLESAEALPLHPDDRQRLERQWGYAASNGSEMHFIGRLLGAGEERWCRIMATVAEDTAGQLLYSGVMLDVTRQQRDEQALREHERRLRTLAENLPGAVYRCLLDEERTMLFVSEGVLELTGYPGSDFIGGVSRSLADIIHPDDLQRVMKHIAEAAEQNTDFACEYRIHTPNGLRWVYDKGQAVRSELDLDDVLWLDGLILDITPRKEAEEAMRQARLQADQANRAKGEFLARMSHEIRTPMNAVLGLCHLALQTDLDARQRDYLRKLHAAASSLLGIINDILDFSKIEAGRLDLEALPFRLEPVLDTLRDIVSLPAAEKGLELRIIVDDDVPVGLVGDRLRLGQVLVNLANNAVKFTEQGFVELRVGVRQLEEQIATLHFEVRDSGIGISQEQFSRLFESFSQADGSITRRYGGTGLGLAICKRLVQLMQGEIWVQSAPGSGSTFAFTARFGLPETLPELPQDSAADARLESIRGARVLLAEDSEINRQIACELLQQAGLEVDTAADGSQALRMAREREYAAVLMDVQMPGLDGLEATRRLRKEGLRTPVLAMTAHAMAEAREQCLQAGMDDHIPKPIDPARLNQALLRWIPPTSAQERQAHDHRPGADPESRAQPDLPLIPGVDTAAGLARAGGNAHLYRRLLKDFARSHADAGQELQQALQEQPEQVRALAHKTAGVAASLGAMDLARAAKELERACAGDMEQAPLQETAQAFQAELHRVLQGLRELSGQMQERETPLPAAQPAPQQLATLAPLAEDMAEALERDLGQAMRLLEELRPLCTGEHAGVFAALEQALGVFDTEEATAQLRKLTHPRQQGA